jgi:hypothetical protein
MPFFFFLGVDDEDDDDDKRTMDTNNNEGSPKNTGKQPGPSPGSESAQSRKRRRRRARRSEQRQLNASSHLSEAPEHSAEEARDVTTATGASAECPTLDTGTRPEASDSKKRPRSVNTPEAATSKRANTGSATYSATYAHAAQKPLILRILSVEDRDLTNEDKDHLSDIVNEKIMSHEDSAPVQLAKVTVQNGEIRVSCANAYSLAWLRKVISEIKDDRGKPRFHARGPGDSPPMTKYTVLLRNGLKPAMFLTLVQKGNPSLDTKKFHIKSAPQAKGDKHYILVIGVELDQVPLLQKLKYRPYCGLGTVEFRGKMAKKPPPVSTLPKSTEDEPKTAENAENTVCASTEADENPMEVEDTLTAAETNKGFPPADAGGENTGSEVGNVFSDPDATNTSEDVTKL